ncbi:MAG: hypothetical protein HY775_06800 [Acidobacteria bacterium]|nr:hypothetical protein [Acidobacteriota bacterium]
MRIHRLLAAALVLGALVPVAARATYNCDSEVVIFTGNQRAPVWLNSGALTCDLLYPDADGRIVNPGSNQLSLRFTNANLGVPTETAALPATLDGLGFSAFSIELKKATLATGDVVWDSARVSIPGASPSGCVTATVTLPDLSTASNSFHTIDSSCPDFP